MQVEKTASNIGFIGYVPVSFFKKAPSGNYERMADKSEIRKCQSFVVRNLNGTLKNKNEDFINFYKTFDKDYEKNPFVYSIYDKTRPIVFMVSGCDANEVSKLAKPIGTAKQDAIEHGGKSYSLRTKQAIDNYFKNAFSYLKNSSERLKSENGKDLSLYMFFEPKYSKKGDIKKFEYQGAKFTERKKTN